MVQDFVCAGVEYAAETIAEILRVVFRLQNVRRAPGDAGRLSGFTEIVNETETNVWQHIQWNRLSRVGK